MENQERWYVPPLFPESKSSRWPFGFVFGRFSDSDSQHRRVLVMPLSPGQRPPLQW